MGAGKVEPKLDEALGADPVRSRLLQQEWWPNIPSFPERIADGGVLLGDQVDKATTLGGVQWDG